MRLIRRSKLSLRFGACRTRGQLQDIYNRLVCNLKQMWMPATAAAQKTHTKTDTVLAGMQQVAVSVPSDGGVVALTVGTRLCGHGFQELGDALPHRFLSVSSPDA